jgi:hypothetical protein
MNAYRGAIDAARRIDEFISAKPRTTRALREKIRVELNAAYAKGYSEGHEWQMKMRIQDAKECREKNGRHL